MRVAPEIRSGFHSARGDEIAGQDARCDDNSEPLPFHRAMPLGRVAPIAAWPSWLNSGCARDLWLGTTKDYGLHETKAGYWHPNFLLIILLVMKYQ